MKEIDLQSDIIAAVIEGGGAAHKLSHRFSVGVADLLVKLPGGPSKLIEVKLNERPAQAKTPIVLDITRPQVEFLMKYHKAGMVAGIMSLAHDRTKGKRLMWGRAFSVLEWEKQTSLPFVACSWMEITTENRLRMLRRLVRILGE
jgi:hypothetical protein